MEKWLICEGISWVKGKDISISFQYIQLSKQEYLSVRVIYLVCAMFSVSSSFFLIAFLYMEMVKIFLTVFYKS